jgi:hypothetical protein
MHAGHEDDRRAFKTRMLADHSGGFKSIHAWHTHIEQNQREGLFQ